MPPLAWIAALLVMAATARAQELGDDDPQQAPSAVLDELRRLRARIDALESARPAADRSGETSSIDLSGEELVAIQEPATDHVLARRWFENVDISGYGAFTYLDTGGAGTSENGSFLVKEASLFLDVEIWDRVFLKQETWIVRFPIPDQFMVGELYANVRNVFDADEGDGVGVKVGRIEVPFGEDYVRWDANETRWISFTAADPYGIDEGVELYGSAGGMHWIAALMNGSGGSSDDSPAKLGALKLYGQPWKDLYSSVSVLASGDSGRSAWRLSGAAIEPVGAGGTTSSAGASPSSAVDLTSWEADARIAEGRRASLNLQYGQAFIGDDVDAFDRDLSWYAIEPTFKLTEKLELLLRYSQIGTGASDEGYVFSGKPIAEAEDFGFDVHSLQRLSGGLCWTPNPHIRAKLEVGHDWVDLIDASPLDAQNDERLYIGLELVTSF
jgi:hypothetical protein